VNRGSISLYFPLLLARKENYYMLNIKTLLTDDLTVWADFPGYPGFEVNIRYISRDIARKLREENTENVWDSTLKRSREKLK